MTTKLISLITIVGWIALSACSGGGSDKNNEAVSFWNVGFVASPGIEDMAEAGLIVTTRLYDIGSSVAELIGRNGKVSW